MKVPSKDEVSVQAQYHLTGSLFSWLWRKITGEGKEKAAQRKKLENML